MTSILVEGARAVDDVTTPSSASPSPTSNQSQSSRVRAAEWSTSCSARLANRYFCSSFELRGKREFHTYGLGHMRMSDLPTSYGHMAVAILTTFNSSTPLAGILTFSEVPQMAVRSRVQLRWRAGRFMLCADLAA